MTFSTDTNTNTNNSKTYRPNVGIMLINDKGEILIGERNDIPGAWQMPQGGIEEGEDIIAAARRELCEEAGVSPALTDFVKRTDDWIYYDYPDNVSEVHKKHRGQKQIWVLLKFKGKDKDITPDTAEPEFLAFKWASPKEVIALITPFKRPIYESAINELLG